MILDIRFVEIMEEIKEDLELQAGFLLNKAQLKELQQYQTITLRESEIKPYVKDIAEYLANTQPDERVWSCHKDLSSNIYVISIEVNTPHIKLNTFDINH